MSQSNSPNSSNIDKEGGKMREIKFRAWDGSHWWGAFTLADIYEKGAESELDAYWGRDADGLPDFTGMTMVQFTGLKDKNGVEIYEGDVVRFDVENQNMWNGGTRGEIYYEETEACFVIMNKGKSYVTIGHGYDAYPGSLEVIGNIYENPELLK